MNRIKTVAHSTKEFVQDHKVAISITLTAACCLVLNKKAMHGHDEFLKERGLYEEFYTPEESY